MILVVKENENKQWKIFYSKFVFVAKYTVYIGYDTRYISWKASRINISKLSRNDPVRCEGRTKIVKIGISKLINLNENKHVV